MPSTTMSCSAGRRSSSTSSPATLVARRRCSRASASASIDSVLARRLHVEAVAQEVRAGLGPAADVVFGKKVAPKLALNEGAEHERSGNEDDLVHGPPEGVGVGAEHAGGDQPFIAGGDGKEPVEELGAGVGALRERPGEVVPERWLVAHQGGGNLRSPFHDVPPRAL